MRDVDIVMEGIFLLSEISEHGEHRREPSSPSDEEIDRQFDQLQMAGMQSGAPFNIHASRVPVGKS